MPCSTREVRAGRNHFSTALGACIGTISGPYRDAPPSSVDSNISPAVFLFLFLFFSLRPRRRRVHRRWVPEAGVPGFHASLIQCMCKRDGSGFHGLPSTSREKKWNPGTGCHQRSPLDSGKPYYFWRFFDAPFPTWRRAGKKEIEIEKRLGGSPGSSMFPTSPFLIPGGQKRLRFPLLREIANRHTRNKAPAITSKCEFQASQLSTQYRSGKDGAGLRKNNFRPAGPR